MNELLDTDDNYVGMDVKISDLQRIYRSKSSCLADVILAILSTVPPSQFTTSRWVQHMLKKVGIEREISKITPELNRMKRKEPVKRTIHGKTRTIGVKPTIESIKIKWDDDMCIGTIVDVPNHGRSYAVSKIRLDERGREKVKKILKFT